MKIRLSSFLIIFVALSAYAQDITGQWNGVLKIQGIQLRLVFHITKSDTTYSSTMDSPDQGAKGIPVTSTAFDSSTLTLKVANLGIQYEGLYSEGKFEGIFTQRGTQLPLDLTREEIAKEFPNRPQEPVKPYPYYSEDVTFRNVVDNITLAGTLTLPKQEGKFPCVILISGSGPQNRDEEIMGHKPFLVIADYLTRNGIGVLRFDDRGTNNSSGDFGSATTMDFASDVQSGITYLLSRKEIDSKKIGLIGHSEGGIIAPIVATRSKDVSFIILMAGTGLRGDKILLAQQALIARASGVPEDIIEENRETNIKAFQIVHDSNDTETLRSKLDSYIRKTIDDSEIQVVPDGMTKDDFVAQQIDLMASPWMQFFIKYDPAPTLEKVKCAVLAINGSKDLQVPAKENLSAIENALRKGKNKNFKTIEFENLNHLFQESETGSPSEYAVIEQTFSPKAMEEMLAWINLQVKN